MVPPVILEILKETGVVRIGQILDDGTLRILPATPWTLRNQGAPAERGGPARIHAANCIDGVSVHHSHRHTAHLLNKLEFPLQQGFQSGVELEGRLLETGISILGSFHTRNIHVTLLINLSGKPNIHSFHDHRYGGIILVRHNHKTIPSE